MVSAAHNGEPHRICVCVCTFKRPSLLKRLITSLKCQTVNGAFTFSVLVVDNDKDRSAECTVQICAMNAGFDISYVCEPVQNIALARNRAVDNARGDFIAFIDDDEFPDSQWLLSLHSTCLRYEADGVLGPVVPHFDEKAPEWLIRGKVCERPSYATGTAVHWDYMRTGNVMMRKSLFDNPVVRFDARYGRSGGEDGDFFRRVCEAGARFVWCNEAPVYESVPPERWSASYHLKRSMRIGGLNGERAREEVPLLLRRLPKTMALVIGMSLLSPMLVLLRKHVRMRLLMKLAYEVGWTCGTAGLVFFRVRDDG